MERTNNMAIASFVAAMIALLFFLFWPAKETIITAFIIILIISIITIVLGFIAKKQIKTTNEKGKGLTTASLIIGFILAIFMLLSLLLVQAMKKPEYTEIVCQDESVITDCVINADGTRSCKYAEVFDIVCPADNPVNSN